MQVARRRSCERACGKEKTRPAAACFALRWRHCLKVQALSIYVGGCVFKWGHPGPEQDVISFDKVKAVPSKTPFPSVTKCFGLEAAQVFQLNFVPPGALESIPDKRRALFHLPKIRQQPIRIPGFSRLGGRRAGREGDGRFGRSRGLLSFALVQ